ELVGLDVKVVAVEVDAGETHLLGPRDVPPEVGDREATLVVDPLVPGIVQLGVDGDVRPLADVVHEEALLHAHLVGGQTDARRLVHGLDHPVDKSPKSVVDVGDLGAALLQDGVAEGAYRERGHGIQDTYRSRFQYWTARHQCSWPRIEIDAASR